MPALRIYLPYMNLTTHARLDDPASEPAQHAVPRVDRSIRGQAQVIVLPGAALTDSAPRFSGTARPPVQSRRDIDALTSCSFRGCAERVTCLHQQSP